MEIYLVYCCGRWEIYVFFLSIAIWRVWDLSCVIEGRGYEKWGIQTKLKEVFSQLCMAIYVCIHACVCSHDRCTCGGYICIYTYICLCMWRTEVILRWHFSGTIHLDIWRQSFSLTLNSSSRLYSLAKNPQESISTYLPSTRIISPAYIFFKT